jgi:hypothetical protein
MVVTRHHGGTIAPPENRGYILKGKIWIKGEGGGGLAREKLEGKVL